MTIESAIAFTFAMFILAASPGPGVFATVAQALGGGFRSALDVVAGIIAGDLLFLLLAVYGLSALARTLGELFFIVKIAGGGYLIWLGIKLWLTTPAAPEETHSDQQQTGTRRVLGGLLITLGNPKVILFYAGFLPTFMDLSRLTFGDVAIIAGLVAAVLTLTLGAYAWSAARARAAFAQPRAIRNLNRGAGIIMIGAGTAIVSR
jgi:threonine/homoserine/homoserine lactone efflux protein